MAEVGTQAQQHGNGVNDVFSNQFGMIMIDELYEAMFSLCFSPPPPLSLSLSLSIICCHIYI